MATSTKKNHDYATEWAEKVISGEIIANKKNIQVAQRHLDDLKNGVEGYVWKPEAAIKVINFIEMLPDPQSGKNLKMELFQKFLISSLYGWRDKDNNRRFTKAYISMARKNGKSLILGGVGLYEMQFGTEPERKREVYISSLSLSQSKTIFNMITSQLNMVNAKSPWMRKQFEIRKTDIVHKPSESILAPLSMNPSAVDGKAVQTGLMDEFASQKDTEMYNRIRTSMSLMKNPLLALISTASNDLNSPMYAEYGYIIKLLNKEITNENYFVFCAEMDSEEEIENQDLWVKANPLLSNKSHHKTILKNIKQDIEEQRELGDEQGVLIKNFNMWQATNEETYISPDRWEAIATDEPIDITNSQVYVGIDLARIGDIAAISFAHILEDGRTFVDTHGFVSTVTPIEVKSKRDKIDYMKLAEEGHITISSSASGIIDYAEMVTWLLAYEKKHNLNIKFLVYDNWDADAFINEATKLGAKWTALQLSQGYKGMSPPTKQFRYAVFNKKIVHNNNPLLNLAVRNARVKQWDGNIKIDKDKQREKIDSLIALINAFSESKDYEFKPKSPSEKIKEGKFSF